MNPKYLIVEAAVRYWEDAMVNGTTDTEGTLIPFREGELWCAKVELATGKLQGWPQNVAADIHYKVCDSGRYWLADSEGNRIASWNSAYVPDLLCVVGEGNGDYIILNINGEGAIQGWQTPNLQKDEWTPCHR